MHNFQAKLQEKLNAENKFDKLNRDQAWLIYKATTHWI